jgi:SpoVK/Ycf46/Vps4 family AAA+-type ATPase
MMAGIVAAELGRDIYRIDLSRVASKWVGETEKNLARVFDEAEKAQVVLLFDEADSLFSQRTGIQSANDRFANMEVNFLLQRMEAFDGISILTTNFATSIDDAFQRRLRFRLTFPMPNAELREQLWRSMLPAEAATAPDIDFGRLAARFELSGGHIKNALVRAAFLAAAEGSPIAHDHVHRAAVAEASEIGQAVRG